MFNFTLEMGVLICVDWVHELVFVDDQVFVIIFPFLF